MSAASMNSLDWRRMAIFLVVGAAAIVGATQLMPPPEVPKVARAVSRRAAGEYAAPPADGGPVSVRPVAGAPAPDTPVSSDGSQAEAPPAADAAAGAGVPGYPGVAAAAEAGEAATAEPPIRNLFRPLVAKPRQGGAPPTGPVLPPPGPVVSLPPPTPAPVAPLVPAGPPAPTTQNLQMLGVVELGGKPQVLLKNTATGESRYFAKGDEAFGFTVEEIQESQVGLKHDGRTQRVMMSSAVTIEGPGSTSVSAGTPGFTGFRSRDGGGNGGRPSFGGGRDGGNGGGRGGRNGGSPGGTPGTAAAAGGGGFSTAEIMSLPTWAERLKKLEEVKGQMDADRYERLRSFMQRKVEEEKGGAR